MIPTLYRRGDASQAPAPLFDPAVDLPREELLDPLFGPVPTWRMTESPLFAATVAEHGDPAALDGRVVDIPAAAGPVVEGLVVDPIERDEDEEPSTVVVLPTTAALPLVERPRRSLRPLTLGVRRREPGRGVA